MSESTEQLPAGKVKVVNIAMPFGSMVVFMVKWAIATIPAIIVLTIAGSFTLAIIRIIFGSFHQSLRF